MKFDVGSADVICNCLAREKKISAIKEIRRLKGSSLRETKEFVEKILRMKDPCEFFRTNYVKKDFYDLESRVRKLYNKYSWGEFNDDKDFDFAKEVVKIVEATPYKQAITKIVDNEIGGVQKCQ